MITDKEFIKKEKEDFFEAVINKGICLESGLDKDFNSYRIFEFQGKKFKIKIKEYKK
jgi:hypothetical protein